MAGARRIPGRQYPDAFACVAAETLRLESWRVEAFEIRCRRCRASRRAAGAFAARRDELTFGSLSPSTSVDALCRGARKGFSPACILRRSRPATSSVSGRDQVADYVSIETDSVIAAAPTVAGEAHHRRLQYDAGGFVVEPNIKTWADLRAARCRRRRQRPTLPASAGSPFEQVISTPTKTSRRSSAVRHMARFLAAPVDNVDGVFSTRRSNFFRRVEGHSGGPASCAKPGSSAATW